MGSKRFCKLLIGLRLPGPEDSMDLEGGLKEPTHAIGDMGRVDIGLDP